MAEQKRYLRTWVAAALCLLLCVAAVNLAVDPYGFFRLVIIDGFNAAKPSALLHGQLIKPYLLHTIAPKTLILGDSRSEVGFDPASPLWPEDLKPVFNMGSPGTASYFALRFTQTALLGHNLRVVLVGLDFRESLVDGRSATLAPQQEARELEGERRLPVTREGQPNRVYWLQRLSDMGSVLFSLDALVDSATTIARQSKQNASELTALGFNPNHDAAAAVTIEGHHYLFQQWLEANTGRYVQAPRDIVVGDTGTSPMLGDLQTLMRLCRAEKVRVVIVLYPSHAELLELYRAAGLWSQFEQWKRELTRLVDQEHAAAPAGVAPELWDFAGFTSLTAEPVPAAGDTKSAMRWYWEPAHFKKELGELILKRILGSAGADVPEDFGIKLSPTTVDDDIAQTRAKEMSYRDTHPSDIGKIEELVRSYSRNHFPAVTTKN